jgi:hypothetical protein
MYRVNLLQVITIFLFQMHCMVQICCRSSQNVVVVLPMLCFERAPSSPHPPIRARTSCPRPNSTCTQILSVSSCPRPNSIRARILSAPKDSTHLGAVCGLCPSYSHLCPFLFVPAVVPVDAQGASVDSHLKLPTTTSVGNSKNSYCSKVNLEQ